MKKFFAIILTTFALLFLSAQSVRTTGFDPENVRPNEAFTYTLIFSNTKAKIDIKDIPFPDGLQIVGSNQSRNISISNNSTQSDFILNVVLKASKEGSYKMPAWEIKDGSNKYKIDEANLKVDKNAPQIIKPQSYDPFARQSRQARQEESETIDLNQATSLEFQIAKEKLFVGESIPCKLILKLDGKIFKAGYTLRDAPTPVIKNADAFNFAGFLTTPQAKQSEADSSVTIVYHSIITPLKAGEYEIDFDTLGVFYSRADRHSIFGSLDPFAEAHKFQIQMKPAKIKVDELQNLPANFSNGIGNFKLTQASLDETSLSVGEPCILTIKIGGEGNFERILPPEILPADGWKSYAPKVSFIDSSEGYAYQGTKIFEYTLVPQKPDLTKTPNAEFVFLNSANSNFETIKIDSIKVSVAPSKTYTKRKADEAAKQGESPKEVLELKNAETGFSKILKSPIFWIFQFAVLAAVCVLISFKLKKNKLESDPDFARISKAKKELAQSLKKAKIAAQKSDSKAFFENASLSLKNAICTMSNLEANAITLSDAQRILGAKPENSQLVLDIKIYFEGADAISYGAYTPQSAELEKLCAKLFEICEKLS